jgi:hypothetical protein
MTSNANNEIRAIAQSSSLGRNAHAFDDDDVVRLLRTAIDAVGSQRLFALRYDIDRSDLNAILNGRRQVSHSLAKVLGLRRVYVAE